MRQDNDGGLRVAVCRVSTTKNVKNDTENSLTTCCGGYHHETRTNPWQHTKPQQTMATKRPLARKSKCATSACLAYFRLSKLLFANDDIYNVNEIPETDEFHRPASEMASELGIDWAKMTHEDSNRILVNLLADAFMAMKQDDAEYEYTFTVSVTKKDAPKDNKNGGDGDGGDTGEE